MQDSPSPAQLLDAVATYLRQAAGPALAEAGQSALAYQAKVAANMLDIARRELTLAGASDAEERTRLLALLARVPPPPAAAPGLAAGARPHPGPSPDPPAAQGDDLRALNQRLADAIADGRLTLEHTPGLAEHLWRTTLAKLAVDQPKYASHRRALQARGADGA